MVNLPSLGDHSKRAWGTTRMGRGEKGEERRACERRARRRNEPEGRKRSIELLPPTSPARAVTGKSITITEKQKALEASASVYITCLRLRAYPNNGEAKKIKKREKIPSKLASGDPAPYDSISAKITGHPWIYIRMNMPIPRMSVAKLQPNIQTTPSFSNPISIGSSCRPLEVRR